MTINYSFYAVNIRWRFQHYLRLRFYFSTIGLNNSLIANKIEIEINSLLIIDWYIINTLTNIRHFYHSVKIFRINVSLTSFWKQKKSQKKRKVVTEIKNILISDKWTLCLGIQKVSVHKNCDLFPSEFYSLYTEK